MNKKKRTELEPRSCLWCGDEFQPRKAEHRFCSTACYNLDARSRRSGRWGQRLHDGMRLLSDDFGEEFGDDDVTYQK